MDPVVALSQRPEQKTAAHQEPRDGCQPSGGAKRVLGIAGYPGLHRTAASTLVIASRRGERSHSKPTEVEACVEPSPEYVAVTAWLPTAS